MITAIIIDDETHARQSIRAIIESQLNDVKIINEAGSVVEGVKIIDENKPDLLFLDIDLPDGNGFDILKQINHNNYRVIFITAYQEYALQAIKFSAFDYILKPINPPELIKSVQKCINETVTYDYKQSIETFFSNYNNVANQAQKIVLRTAERIFVVEVKNILHCQADNVYSNIYLESEEKIMVSRNLKSFDELLSPFGFLRVHQSHLINTTFIKCYNKQDGGTVIMSDNTEIPVSNTYRPGLLSFLDNI